MLETLVTATYLGAAILFILTLRGLSHPETARLGNLYGMIGMALAIVATVALTSNNIVILIGGLVVGGTIGVVLARKVQMTQMPELVAVLHSLVGMAAILVGFGNFFDPIIKHVGVEYTINLVETSIGILIGAITFSGSIVAYLKLSAKISGNPLVLPLKHVINLIIIAVAIYGCIQFVSTADSNTALIWLILVTVMALILGIHLVASIGGADMPVVISMLNSYSGWAASAMGFMLSNDLLILTGALVGSSGAILSYIMCKAMNRNFLSVISGGFGISKPSAATKIEGEVTPTDANEVAELLKNAKRVVIVPGYGMAVAQAQHTVSEITKTLKKKDIDVRFAIHPVAGRMPGHMNVLLAEAKVPYDIVFEMEEINDDFPNVDVTIVVGANDIVNPSALDQPDSPIAGMPVLEVWKSQTCVVLKRSMATGYAGVDNPLFYMPNTRMLFGNAQTCLDEVLKSL